MAASNDRFAVLAGEATDLGETALQSPARARSFRSPGSPSSDSYHRPQFHSSGNLDREGVEVRRHWEVRDAPSRGSGHGSITSSGAGGDEDIAILREPVRVAIDGERAVPVAGGRRNDVASSTTSSHDDTIASQTSPTPPLADASNASGERRGKGRRKSRSSAAIVVTEAEHEEREEAVVLPSLDEARRSFEAKQEKLQQSAAAGLPHENENAASLGRQSADAAAGASSHQNGEEREVVESPSRSSSSGLTVGTPDPVELSVSFVGEELALDPASTAEVGVATALPQPARDATAPQPQPACSSGGEGEGERSTGCQDAGGADVELEGREEGVSLGIPPPMSSSSARGSFHSANGNGRAAAAATSVNMVDDSRLPQARFDAFDGGVALEGTMAVAPELTRSDLTDVPEVLSLSGRSGGSSRERVDGGGYRGGSGGPGAGGAFTLSHSMVGPVSGFSQALHMALAFFVVILVAFAKSGDGAIACGAPYSNAAGAGGGGSGGGRDGSNGRKSSGVKQRRRSGSNVGYSSSIRSSPVVRRLRAAWSKVWHMVEDDLATRWHAAGQALASLRQAWAALWVPPPHAEADVLAEALASPPRYSRRDQDRRRRAGGGAGGGRGGAGERRRRGGRRSSRSGELGPAESPDEKSYLRRPVGLNCLNFLSLCGYRPLTGAGGSRKSRSPKFLLLLDLDETLVHCSPHLMEPSRRRGGSGGGSAVRPDLKLEMRGGAPSDRPACMFAWKRPHLDVFLGVVSRWYELAVFTSSRQCFAEPLIDLIDSRCVIGKRFYRDSCTRRDGSSARDDGDDVNSGTPTQHRGGAAGQGSSAENLKDLRVAGSEHFPLRTVIVDNQPRTVVQQANVLPIRSWFPHHSEDRQLLDLLPVLLALTSCRDVRSVLGLRQGTGAPTVSPTKLG